MPDAKRTAAVRRAINAAGDLYLVGEWYCVVSSAQGVVDVTPSPTGKTRILFAAHPNLPDGDDGLHPSNVRARIYNSTGRLAELETKLLQADDAARATARNYGITARQLMLSRLPRDPLAAEIDDYLHAEGKVQATILAAHDGSRDWDPSEVEGWGRNSRGSIAGGGGGGRSSNSRSSAMAPPRPSDEVEALQRSNEQRTCAREFLRERLW